MKQILNRISEVLMSAIVIVMILAVCWQVFSRYVLNYPSGVTEELLRYSLIWLTMVGGAYAYGQGKHIAVSFAIRNISELGKMKVRMIIDVVVILFSSIVLVYGGIVTSLNAVGQVSAALRMPMQFLYLSLVVSGIIIVFHAVTNILARFRDLKSMN